MLLPQAHLHAHAAGPPPATDFVMRWTAEAADSVCKLNCRNVGTYSGTIDWGDGSGVQPFSSYDDANLTHTYASSGTYTCTVTGSLPSPYIYGAVQARRDRLAEIVQWGQVGFVNLEQAFRQCTNLRVTATDAGDFSAVTTMREMFFGCTSLQTFGLGWDVSACADMVSMCEDCTALDNPDVWDWDLASATNINSMFKNIRRLRGTLNWNTPVLENISQLCRNTLNCSVDVSSFDVSNITNANNAFNGTRFSNEHYDALLQSWAQQSLQSGVTLNVGNAYRSIARDADYNTIIAAGWTIEAPSPGYSEEFIVTVETTGAGETFTWRCGDYGAYNAQIDWGDGQQDTITAYNDAALTHSYASPGTHTIRVSGDFPWVRFNGGGDVGKLRNIANWGDVPILRWQQSYWGASNMEISATDMPDLSACDNAINAFVNVGFMDAWVGGWNFNATSNVAGMFYGARTVDIDGEMQGFPLADSLADMFYNCNEVDPKTSNWVMNGITTMYRMFYNGYKVNPDTSTWGTSALQNAQAIFYNCIVANPPVEAWDVANVDNFRQTFAYAILFNRSLRSWNMSAALDMTDMLIRCDSMDQQNVDDFLFALYDQRMNFGWATPAVDISDMAEPSGPAYEYTGSPPVTGKEVVHWLQYDPEGEGFNTWTITV